jgi:WD40 repeat protein
MGRAIETVRQTDAAIHSVAFSCDGRWLAAGGREGVVRLYEVGSGLRNPHTIANESGPVRSVGFSRDGRYLAIVTDTWLSAGLGQVAIWDVRTTTHVATLTFSAPMAVAEFAADNSLLVVDWTGNVTRRSIFGGETLMRTTISKDLVSAASFSADTRALEGAMEVLCPGSG